MDRAHRTLVACVHRLQHVERLTASALADDDPIGAHTERVADQVADLDCAFAFHIGRPGFEPDDVLLPQLQLG